MAGGHALSRSMAAARQPRNVVMEVHALNRSARRAAASFEARAEVGQRESVPGGGPLCSAAAFCFTSCRDQEPRHAQNDGCPSAS